MFTAIVALIWGKEFNEWNPLQWESQVKIGVQKYCRISLILSVITDIVILSKVIW